MRSFGGHPAEVAVGAGQALVAELGGDEFGRQPLGGQFGRVGEPQALGVDPLRDPGLLGQPGQQLAHVGRVERPARQRAEQRRALGQDEAPDRASSHSADDPSAAVDAGDPVPALADPHPDAETPRLGVDVRGQERQGLVEPQARPVQRDQQSPVAEAGGAPVEQAPSSARNSSASGAREELPALVGRHPQSVSRHLHTIRPAPAAGG